MLKGWALLASVKDENDPIPAEGLVYDSIMTAFELHVTQYGDKQLHYYHLKNAIKILRDHFKSLPANVKVPSRQVYVLSEDMTVQGTVRIFNVGASCHANGNLPAIA